MNAVRRLGVVLLVAAAACTPPIRQFDLKEQKLTCAQANEYVYRTLQGMRFAITGFEPATIGHPGEMHGTRNEAGPQHVTAIINCAANGTASITASEDSRLLGQIDFKRSFYMAFTGIAAAASVREAEARREAERPVGEKKEKGLRVMLEPVAGLAAKLDFDFDLAADGILPVRVTINNGSTRTYTLDPADVVLIQRDGSRVPSLAVADAVARIVGAEQGAGAQPVPDSAAITRRLDQRLLRTGAVGANQSLTGYLFFPLGTYTKGRVSLEDQESGEGEGVVVEF